MTEATPKKATVAVQSAITEVQRDLGAPHDRNENRKEPLLKIRVGDVMSNLSLTERYDSTTGRYLPPEPTYSIGFTEKIRKADGSIESKYNSIPIPKDSESLRALGEHLVKVAKALEGIELRSSSQEVDDLDNALNRLKQFKSSGKEA